MENQYQNEMEYTCEEPISVGNWMLIMLILAIPIVGIVMAFVWGFGNTSQKTKKNFSRAILIYYAISIVLGILFSSSLFAMLATMGTYY